MPDFLSVIFNNFLNSYAEDGQHIKKDRDVLLNFYLYFSYFMDSQIKLKRNGKEKAKYKNLKKLGLSYIKLNDKKILNHLRTSV